MGACSLGNCEGFGVYRSFGFRLMCSVLGASHKLDYQLLRYFTFYVFYLLHTVLHNSFSHLSLSYSSELVLIDISFGYRIVGSIGCCFHKVVVSVLLCLYVTLVSKGSYGVLTSVRWPSMDSMILHHPHFHHCHLNWHSPTPLPLSR